MASKTTEAPEHPEVAEDIIEAQRAHRLSDLKLAKAAGISPRHLREVKKGSNVSLRILKQLMAALQMPGIRFGNLMKGSGSLEGVSPEVLQMMAHAMKQAIAPVLELIEMLQAYGEGSISPAVLNSKARDLVRNAAGEPSAESVTDTAEGTTDKSIAPMTKRRQRRTK